MARSRIPASLAGLITGIRFATKSLEPSLMPRSAIDQGIIMGGSFLTGFLAGSGAARVVAILPLPSSGPAMRVVSVAAASARSAQVLNTRDPSAPAPIDEREAWGEIGAEVMSALALSGWGSKGRPPIARMTTGGAVLAGTAVEAQSGLARREDPPDLAYLATSVGVAAGLNGVVAGLAGAVYGSGRLARRFSGRGGPVGSLAFAVGSVMAVAAIGTGLRIGIGAVLGKLAASNRMTEAAYAEVPDANGVSGSRYSLAPYHTLGLQGRRLVSEHTPVEDIADIMGEPVRKPPVRVYIGLGSAQDEDERVELAVQELKRAGGFDRSLIIAASPAGTGYVNYIAVEAAELMARGDVATVAIQYGEVPSMLSIDKVGAAASVYAKLLRRLRSEIDDLDRGIRLAAYGESLGAITCQMGVLDASSGIDALAVDHALWVGTPQGSKLFASLTGAGVPVFDHFDEVRDHLGAGNDAPSVYFLNHDNDPVTKFTPELFYRMPDWLATNDRGRNMDPSQRWLPGIMFWQTLIDTKNAATVVPGEFFSTGHDYRADLAEFIRAAYGFSDVSDAQMEAIEERLRHSEVTRAAKISEGRIPTEAP
jgi:uncharacterized membrane protein